MKVCEVVWLDAWVESGDYSIKRAKKCKPIITSTIGYRVAENEHGGTLATDKYTKDKKNVKIVNFIPWGIIEEYWEFTNG